MARRKRKLSGLRIAVWVALLVAVAALAWFGHRHADRWLTQLAGDKSHPIAASMNDAPHRIEGTLSASGPARDGQLGVSANAAALLRHVEMYQWQEHCEGGACRYDKAWSAPVDSRRFREPAAHANPPVPFSDSVFFAPGLKLDTYALDPDLLTAQLHATEYAVRGANLPPNLAATFSERDGVLYAGGDPAHPALGEVRVSYRSIPTGTVALNGVVRVGKLVNH